MNLLRAVSTAVLLCLTATTLQAQQPGISLDSVNGYAFPTELAKGSHVRFVFGMEYDGSTHGGLVGTSNGFRLFSSDGDRFVAAIDSGLWTTTMLDCGFSEAPIYTFSNDGLGADTIAVASIEFGPPSNCTSGPFVESAIAFDVYIPHDITASQFCIDSSWFPPAGLWIWDNGSGGIVPDWDGPHCFTLVDYPCTHPVILNCPEDPVVGFPDGEVVYDFDDDYYFPDSVTYYLEYGPGEIDPETGVWSWSTPGVGYGFYPVAIHACGSECFCSPTCEFTVEIANPNPQINNCPPMTLTGGPFDTVKYNFNCEHYNPAAIRFYMYGGPGQIDQVSGLWEYAPAGDTGMSTVGVIACDGDSCSPVCQFEVEIEGCPETDAGIYLDTVLGSSYWPDALSRDEDITLVFRLEHNGIDEGKLNYILFSVVVATQDAGTFEVTPNVPLWYNELHDCGFENVQHAGLSHDGLLADTIQFRAYESGGGTCADYVAWQSSPLELTLSFDPEADELTDVCIDSCTTPLTYWLFSTSLGPVRPHWGGPYCYPVISSCCEGIRGDLDMNGTVNIVDLNQLVGYLFLAGEAPSCLEEADVDASGAINIADLTWLVAYMFQGGPQPEQCAK